MESLTWRELWVADSCGGGSDDGRRGRAGASGLGVREALCGLDWGRPFGLAVCGRKEFVRALDKVQHSENDETSVSTEMLCLILQDSMEVGWSAVERRRNIKRKLSVFP